ncbi:acyl CoA:acetate/3-ketoacid CoA transferase [Thiohalocapsa halophila]|uniref:Acyl CoA:acetate/3-ketoacid CoA transferase n=1 Tax=Thiohalocapsa halophila TaxID=69359 RepID=A0ABS1CGS5_9GAMM|nr:malonate decarboxylase subunit alpha [Thiohalocapsa halophila]MBK1631114.1 acyl CoA:acetate/3-ketoacid CoA transferase [Thiohalocapsa halophila]
MTNKLVSAEEAVRLVHDGDTLVFSGFGVVGVPDALGVALEKRFLETGTPRELTLFFGGGPGDGQDQGANRLAHEGLIKRAIGGHWGLVPKIGELALADKIEAYNLPLGVISHLYREIAAGKPGCVSPVGLGTFVDPRLEGGKVNTCSEEDLVEIITLGGREMLFFKAPTPNVAFIRATTADGDGNLTLNREALTQDTLAIAMATRNAGGLVIAQVEYVTETGALLPRQVQVPGILVDCVVVATPEHHWQTYGTQYSPALSGEMRVPLDALPAMALDARKVIARRAAFELMPNAVVNLGIGMPEGVANIAAEEHLLPYMTLTAEPGIIGGVPGSGLNFGTSINAAAQLDMNQQFDFYDGGGLDLAVLGLAECDARGNINVSRFGGKLAGAGGFINITQNSRIVIFVGTFMAGGLKVKVGDGKLEILSEGKYRKFVDTIDQVTFSGEYAAQQGKRVLYVTERCVLALTPEGLALTEVAPGIDIERDILPYMAFRPIIEHPQTMDPRIFSPEPMGLKDSLLAISLLDRISYDAERNLLFLNFQGLKLRTPKDAQDIQDAVERRCKEIGKQVDVIVNYDGFEVSEPALDAYARVVEYMVTHYYGKITRYTTSAFLRDKLGTAIQDRGLAPHIFETRTEAETAL